MNLVEWTLDGRFQHCEEISAPGCMIGILLGSRPDSLEGRTGSSALATVGGRLSGGFRIEPL